MQVPSADTCYAGEGRPAGRRRKNADVGWSGAKLAQAEPAGTIAQELWRDDALRLLAGGRHCAGIMALSTRYAWR
jgi:hypothetical protein